MNNQKGITLIALVITVIVMLILVAVTINIATNGGLFTSATKAKDDTIINTEKDKLISSMKFGNDGYVTDLSTNDSEWEKSGDSTNGWTVTNNSTGNKYTISKAGKISLVDDNTSSIWTPIAYTLGETTGNFRFNSILTLSDNIDDYIDKCGESNQIEISVLKNSEAYVLEMNMFKVNDIYLIEPFIYNFEDDSIGTRYVYSFSTYENYQIDDKKTETPYYVNLEANKWYQINETDETAGTVTELNENTYPILNNLNISTDAYTEEEINSFNIALKNVLVKEN